MTEDLQYVGGSYPVHDVAQKVTGELIYGSDFSVPGMLHAKLILSPIPHGIVKQIDTSRAEALPGVVKVFTCFELADATVLPGALHPGRSRAARRDALQRARALRRRPRRRVVATSGDRQAAAALVEVEYDELPALLTVDEALRQQGRPGPLHRQRRVRAEVDKGGAPTSTDAVVVSDVRRARRACITRRSSRTSVSPSATAPASITIWTTSQGVYGVRTVVADLLSLAYHRCASSRSRWVARSAARQEFILEPVTAFLAHAYGPSGQARARSRGVHRRHHRPACHLYLASVPPSRRTASCSTWRSTRRWTRGPTPAAPRNTAITCPTS